MADRLAVGLSELTVLLLESGSDEIRPALMADVMSGMLPEQPLVTVILDLDMLLVGGSAGGGETMLAEEIRVDDGPRPSREAIRIGKPVSLPDTAADTSCWGDYSRRMCCRGIGSVQAQPLTSEGATIGAFTLYADRPHRFDPDLMASITLAADHTGVLLGISRQLARTRRLWGTLSARATVDRAIGIVMGQRHCNADTALQVLHDFSVRCGIEVAQAASGLIATLDGEPVVRVSTYSEHRAVRATEDADLP